MKALLPGLIGVSAIALAVSSSRSSGSRSVRITRELLYPSDSVEALDGAAKILESKSFDGVSDEGLVLYDALGLTKMPSAKLKFEIGSLQHRWIVMDAVFCARAAASLMGPDSLHCLDVVERWASGGASLEEVREAQRGACGDAATDAAATYAAAVAHAAWAATYAAAAAAVAADADAVARGPWQTRAAIREAARKRAKLRHRILVAISLPPIGP